MDGTVSQPILRVAHPGVAARIGTARRDITPPAGINARMWGSAHHDVAEGIHRPLTATVLTVQPLERHKPLILASLDLGWWRSREDEWFLRGPILNELALAESDVMIHLTHTHAGPSISLCAERKPGGDRVRPYLLTVRRALAEAIGEALSSSCLATLAWNTGRCNLACHRDQPNPQGSGTIVGYNPKTNADDTLLVGRVTDESGRVIATLVNYACHPTTLGPGNRLISPDYVGAMRELVEQATEGAPCLFLNGAAGDLAPRQQYADQTGVADQNGRQLGHAVLATLSDMFPHQAGLRFSRIEESSARLGRWELADQPSDVSWGIEQLKLQLPLRQLELLDEMHQRLIQSDDRTAVERIERRVHMHNGFADTKTAELPVWVWKLGGSLLVGCPAELHSPFQVELRRKFGDHAVVVMNVVNGFHSYLPPLADFAQNTYQSDVSMLGPGAHEKVLEACSSAFERLLAGDRADSAVAAPHFRPQPVGQPASGGS